MQHAANVTSSNPVDWHAIDWKQVYRRVRNLRQRIFRASRDNDLKKVRSLQRLMLRCRANVIEAAFNNIGHAALVQTIGNFPTWELIKQWLEAGYVEEEMLYPTDTGGPQGGVSSSLLLNMALHGRSTPWGVRTHPKARFVGHTPW